MNGTEYLRRCHKTPPRPYAPPVRLAYSTSTPRKPASKKVG